MLDNHFATAKHSRMVTAAAEAAHLPKQLLGLKELRSVAYMIKAYWNGMKHRDVCVSVNEISKYVVGGYKLTLGLDSQ